MGSRPHPLAQELVELNIQGKILVVGIGNGRNLFPLITAMQHIEAVEADIDRLDRLQKQESLPLSNVRVRHADWENLPYAENTFAAILSTHVFQHGTRARIKTILRECLRVLSPGGHLFLVFSSKRDARYREGTFVDDDCWAPLEGDEVGVPHLYCDEHDVREMLKNDCLIDRLDEHCVDTIVGQWAHENPHNLFHWFVRARKRLGSGSACGV